MFKIIIKKQLPQMVTEPYKKKYLSGANLDTSATRSGHELLMDYFIIFMAYTHIHNTQHKHTHTHTYS